MKKARAVAGLSIPVVGKPYVIFRSKFSAIASR